jgi:hypothetical protein
VVSGESPGFHKGARTLVIPDGEPAQLTLWARSVCAAGGTYRRVTARQAIFSVLRARRMCGEMLGSGATLMPHRPWLQSQPRTHPGPDQDFYRPAGQYLPMLLLYRGTYALIS